MYGQWHDPKLQTATDKDMQMPRRPTPSNVAIQYNQQRYDASNQTQDEEDGETDISMGDDEALCDRHHMCYLRPSSRRENGLIWLTCRSRRGDGQSIIVEPW